MKALLSSQVVLSGDRSKRCTVRLSFIFVSTFRNSCLPDREALVLPLASPLLHFDQMSNGDGDVTFFRSLETIENGCGKHSMYLMYFIITAQN